MDIIGMIILAGAAGFAAGYNIAGDTYIVKKPYESKIEELSDKAYCLRNERDILIYKKEIKELKKKS